MLEQLKDLLEKLNSKGFPLPVLKDPLSQLPSVSLTLTFISFNIVVIGLIGKISGYLGGIDLDQSIVLFGVCASLYWSRRVGVKGKTTDVTVEEKKE